MAKKKTRDCTKCIAYCNMLGGEENLCGLGFGCYVHGIKLREMIELKCNPTQKGAGGRGRRPKELGVFGASYVWPVFVKMGIIKKSK